MSWDIYGEPLARNHCEVHPHVGEPYPCGLCLQEGQARDDARREEEAYWQEQADWHYAEMEHEHLVLEDLGPCSGAWAA